MIANNHIIEELETALQNPRLTVMAKRSVNIYSDMGDTVREGDIITMTGELVGFDDMDVTVQWQYDNGMCWTDVPGANKTTHAFVATAETINYSWRLSVSIPE